MRLVTEMHVDKIPQEFNAWVSSSTYRYYYPALAQGCVCVYLCVKILKTRAKEPFRQKDGLKADIYAICRITFMFICVVVLETAVSAIYIAPRVMCDCCARVLRRILPCEIAASRLL